MSLTAELILPEDVLLIPVADLEPGLREELGEPDAFALTRPRGRSTSSLVGPDVAELLAEFRSPTTVVAAVLRYSRRHDLDPQTILADAFPALQQCLGEGFLVPPGSSAASEIVASVAPGTIMAGATVGECLRVLDDTEVYRAQLPDGTPAALKLARESGAALSDAVRESFVREAAVLRVVDGAPGPELLADGSHAERPHLLLEWCDGLPVTGAGRADPAAILLAVLAGYVRLHELGVRHGDIHPGNVLVDSAGVVRIIDFGLASAPGVPGQPRRGGLQHYFEPEFAAAVLERRRPPRVTPAGEVFALAALGYEIVTGAPWIDLGLDSDEAMRRILDREPVPFREHRVHGHRELERVLRSGLAVDPAARPATVADLAAQVAAAVEQDAAYTRAAVGGAGRAARYELIDDLLAPVLPGGWLFESGPAAPTASVSHGAAGIALALLRIAGVRADPDLLVCADGWAERAHRLRAHPDAFSSPDMADVVVADGTPYHRASGVGLTRALVAHATGSPGARRMAVEDFLADAGAGAVLPDVTLGTGGVLLGASLLFEAMRVDPYADTEPVRALGGRVATELWDVMTTAGDIGASSTITALGVAHGWAGLLLALLRWSSAVGDVVPDGVVDRLDELAALAEPTPAGVQWRWSNAQGRGAGVAVPGWCNGTAGHLMLYTQAYRSLGAQRYLELAQRAGARLAATAGGLPQLCCGAAGQGYALLDLYRVTGEHDLLLAVHRIAQGMADDLADATGTAALAGAPAAGAELVPGSLYRGPLGAAALLCELDRPEQAAMPAFGLEGW